VAALVAGHRGGILSLLELIDEHGEALQYDLIERQLRLQDLGLPHFTWFDLKVLVRFLPPSSALYRELQPEAEAWGLTEQLLASATDALNLANWQRGGGKGARPKPIKRPGIDNGETSFGSGAVTFEEIDEFFGYEFSPGTRQN
jgi:hypothetical protein